MLALSICQLGHPLFFGNLETPLKISASYNRSLHGVFPMNSGCCHCCVRHTLQWVYPVRNEDGNKPLPPFISISKCLDSPTRESDFLASHLYLLERQCIHEYLENIKTIWRASMCTSFLSSDPFKFLDPGTSVGAMEEPANCHRFGKDPTAKTDFLCPFAA